MRYFALIVITVLVGCLSPPGPSSDDVVTAPPGDAPSASPPSQRDNGSVATAPRIVATAGTIHIDGVPAMTVGRVANGEASRSFETDAEGNATIPFLEPATTYEIQIDNQSFDVTTQPLTWNWTDGDPSLIQPGWTFANDCTLSAILRDADYETLYGVMMAHCADGIGDEIRMQESDGGHVIGEVVSYWYHEGEATDEALIFEIPRSYYNQVNPQIREIGGPTGIGLAALELEEGDRLCFYGHGYDGETFSEQEPFRARCGEYTGSGDSGGQANDTFGVKARADGGDSGAALIDDEGIWHGIIAAGVRHDSALAMSACKVLYNAALDGFELALVPAPYNGFEPAPFNNGSTGIWTTVVHDVLADGEGPCAQVVS